MSRYDWMDSALCAQTDPGLFHVDGIGGGYNTAKKICATCPVARQCADFAQRIEGEVSHPHRHGMWGGQVPRQRANDTGATARRDAHTRRRDAIRRLHQRGGLDAYQIATAVGCNVRTVWRTLAHTDLGEAA